MRYYIKIIFTSIIISLLNGGTPIEYSIVLTGGYDNNAMRFSKDEFQEASYDMALMGGAKTFDSFVTRFRFSANKSLIMNDSRSVKMSTFYATSDYRDTPDKKYWSGGIDAIAISRLCCRLELDAKFSWSTWPWICPKGSPERGARFSPGHAGQRTERFSNPVHQSLLPRPFRDAVH